MTNKEREEERERNRRYDEFTVKCLQRRVAHMLNCSPEEQDRLAELPHDEFIKQAQPYKWTR